MHINHSKYNQSTGIPTRPADIRRTATSVELNTHDFALAELRGRLRNLKGGDYGPKILKLSPSNQIQDESQAAIESAVEHHVPSIENVYDAFTGGHIGTVSGDQEGAPSDEMWNHLAKIRHLQSEIATMHLTMEGLGSGIELEKPADDSEADNLDETKSVKEHTFSQLESRFLGRKNAVEAVMSKLDSLSQALKDFHSLQNPDLIITSTNFTDNETYHDNIPKSTTQAQLSSSSSAQALPSIVANKMPQR